jgi:hypothetical protein
LWGGAHRVDLENGSSRVTKYDRQRPLRPGNFTSNVESNFGMTMFPSSPSKSAPRNARSSRFVPTDPFVIAHRACAIGTVNRSQRVERPDNVQPRYATRRMRLNVPNRHGAEQAVEFDPVAFFLRGSSNTSRLHLVARCAA